MPGVLAWGYYPTDKIWLPIQVDANGKIVADMSAINLGDLGDVSVPTPGDDYFVYWDAATSLWKCRALVDADIPATICRDSELAYHETLSDVHHATHLKTLADHPLSIIPTMDDDHIPAAIARDTEVATAVSDHTALPSAHHTRYTDAEAKAAAVLAGDITNAETKAPTHDAVYDVKVTADGAIAKALLTERGSVIYRNASAPAELLHGTAGQVLQSGGHNADPSWAALAAGPTTVRKTADEIVNNSIALQNDDHLLLAVGADEVWLCILALKIATTAVADFKFGFTVPNGGAVNFIDMASAVALASWTTAVQSLPTAVDRTNAHSVIFCLYIGGATAGTLQFRWAQNVAEATDTTVKAGSNMIAFKIA